MKILYAASEAAPFVKTGGLGDVADALPRQLAKIDDNEVVVFLPYYASIKNNPEFKLEFVTSFWMSLAWRTQYCGLFKYQEKKKGRSKKKPVTYYFIDNEYYFMRNSSYGDGDDGERFAFFSKAILESLQYIEFYPDVLHCNDWQTGFIPLLYKAFYSEIPEYSNIKTVYTIHNIEYQGKADNGFLTEVLGVDERWRGAATFDNCINAMKSAIVLCDKLTTVSPTYSHELKYAFFAHGLEEIIQENSYKLSGIVNGINTETYNPETDMRIYENYSADTISKKVENKKYLQQQLGLEVNESIPMFAVVSRLVAHKGVDLIEKVMQNIVNMNVQLVVLGTGDKQYEDTFKYYDYAHHNKVSANIKFDGTLANQIYAGADFFLMPSKSEPCGLSQIIAMRYGTIPIVRETGGLVDTVYPLNINDLSGRGFTFKTYNEFDMLDAIMRAESFYYNYDKRHKAASNLMKINFDWSESAVKYMDLYKSCF